MYFDDFGFRTAPFSINPDPAFAVETSAHARVRGRIAAAATSSPAWISLTGAPGVGKTLLCRQLVGQQADVAGFTSSVLLATAFPTAGALMRALADALEGSAGRPASSSLEESAERVGRRLRDAAARGNLLICLDECQATAPDALEAFRRAIDQAAPWRHLVVVLAGSPEFDAALDREDLRALRSRIGLRGALGGLHAEETEGYLRTRLRLAGGNGVSLFPPPIARLVHRAARGNPRAVNLVSHNALLDAWREGATVVRPAHVAAAANETPNASRLGTITRAAHWIESLVGT